MEQSGVSNSFVLAGVNDEIFTSLTSLTYTTPFSVYNNHVYIIINSIAASGIPTVTVTGTVISESTAVPVPDSEIITLDNTVNNYQTLKKFLKVTEISFANVININYNINVLGYVDFLNTNVKIIGYRAELLGDANSYKSDLTLIIEKIKQLNGNTSIETMENIEIDGTNDVVTDNFRTGIYDRSYPYPSPSGTLNRLWPENVNYIAKQTDFDTYFNGGGTITTNTVDGSANEGIIVRVTFNTTPPNGCRYISWQIYYQNV